MGRSIHEVHSEDELAALRNCPNCNSAQLSRIEPTRFRRTLMWGRAPASAMRPSRECQACRSRIEVAR